MENTDNLKPVVMDVEICMGSSCFSRGAKEILSAIQVYIVAQQLEKMIRLRGTLCRNNCQNGPCIRIADTKYHQVDPGVALDLLRHHIEAVESARE